MHALCVCKWLVKILESTQTYYINSIKYKVLKYTKVRVLKIIHLWTAFWKARIGKFLDEIESIFWILCKYTQNIKPLNQKEKGMLSRSLVPYVVIVVVIVIGILSSFAQSYSFTWLNKENGIYWKVPVKCARINDKYSKFERKLWTWHLPQP